MKKYIEVLIDGQKVDLPADGIECQLTYAVRDKDDLTANTGSRTERSLSIPASKDNAAIFDNFQIINNSNETGAELKQCEIYANGIRLLKGRAQLNEVELRGSHYGRLGDSLKVAVYGDNGDWINLIGEKRLSEIDWTDLLHTFSAANVENGTLSSSYPADDYGYCLIKMEDWKYSAGGTVAADVSQFTPFLFIAGIINRIFNSVGYTVISNFLSSSLGAKLILPAPIPPKLPEQYSIDYLNVTAERTGAARTYTNATPIADTLDFDGFLTIPAIGANPFTLSGLDPNLGLPNASFYTVPVDGYYKLTMTITVDNVVGSFTTALVLTSSGVLTNFDPNFTPVNGQTYTFSAIIEAEAGDYIVPYIQTSGIGGGESFDITYARFEIIGEAKAQLGIEVNFKYLLQDWKCLDLLRGLSEMFNLCFETDNFTQTVTIEPKDQWLLTQRFPPVANSLEDGFLNGLEDWTTKLDLSKNASLRAVNDSPTTQRWFFKEADEDETASRLEENEDFKLYEARYILPDTRFKRSDKDNENSFFAATLHLFDDDIMGANSTATPLIPLIWNGYYLENPTNAERVTEITPRILFWGGRSAVSNQSTINVWDGAALQEWDLPEAFMVNYADLDGTDPLLSYCDQTINTNVVRGLVSRFYLRDIARMYAGKQVEEHVFLSELDINNLSFRNKIQLEQSQYELLEVSQYNPLSDGSTKIVVRYDKTDGAIDPDTIEISPIEGLMSKQSE